ncbi:spore cortex biosynthesis protein YabQ [Lactonifactor longoviformis]|uniref:spore cortex biosynthesis protein YabQ n=1 Tax=Lactonifactor longoviformis TaxID=341220 RepID=UPI0036F22F43
MSEYMNQELILFASSVWAGVLMVAAYDVLRIFRRVCAHPALWISIEDILFWTAGGVFLFSRMYEENDGVIRLYALAGILLGVILYHYSVSELLVKYISFFLNKIKGFLKIPLKLTARWIKRLKFPLSRGKILVLNYLSARKVRKKNDERTDKKKNAVKKEKKKRRSKPDRHD